VFPSRYFPAFAPDEVDPLLELLEPWMPRQRPRAFETNFDPPVFSIGAGDVQTFSLDLAVGSSDFVMAFVAIDTGTGDAVGVSEVLLVMGGRLFFAEG
jgi:hypothetical protein